MEQSMTGLTVLGIGCSFKPENKKVRKHENKLQMNTDNFVLFVYISGLIFVTSW